jgi:uncharacterized oxidoreductase
MASVVLNIEDAADIRKISAQLAKEHPALNVVIHNAGIMRPENLLKQPEDLANAEATIATNLLGPIRLNTALLPLLEKQPRATIMTVTSGLASVPLAMTRPTMLRRPPSIPTRSRFATSSSQPTLKCSSLFRRTSRRN